MTKPTTLEEDETGIDIANSSRQIRPAEREECAKNGVTDIVEVKFGYDGIVFASDAKAAELRVRAEGLVPRARRRGSGVDGKLAANTNKTWKQVNPRSPSGRSPPTSRARSTAPAKSSRRRCCTPAAEGRAPMRPW